MSAIICRTKEHRPADYLSVDKSSPRRWCLRQDKTKRTKTFKELAGSDGYVIFCQAKATKPTQAVVFLSGRCPL